MKIFTRVAVNIAVLLQCGKYFLAAEVCMDDENALYWNRNCYRIVQKWFNYYKAKDHCMSIGNTLANIESADQAAALLQLFQNVWKTSSMLYRFWVNFPPLDKMAYYKQQSDLSEANNDPNVNVLRVEFINYTVSSCIGLQWHPDLPNIYTLVMLKQECTIDCCWFMCEENNIFNRSRRHVVYSSTMLFTCLILLIYRFMYWRTIEIY